MAAGRDSVPFQRRRGREWFLKRRRVLGAIAYLNSSGKRISFYNVADLACVARSTLYERDDLFELVCAARDMQCSASGELSIVEETLLRENERLLCEVTDLRSKIERIESTQ